MLHAPLAFVLVKKILWKKKLGLWFIWDSIFPWRIMYTMNLWKVNANVIENPSQQLIFGTFCGLVMQLQWQFRVLPLFFLFYLIGLCIVFLLLLLFHCCLVFKGFLSLFVCVFVIVTVFKGIFLFAVPNLLFDGDF